MDGIDHEILAERDGPVLTITVNRPEKRNARAREHNVRIAEHILNAQFDPEIFLIAITGSGDRAFSSGADLSVARDQADRGERNRGPLHAPERSLFEVMIDCPKPLLAIVNGPAVAGGFELALACDLCVACDTAFFQVPEAKRGRGAHFASVILPQMVPPRIAMEWLFTGRRISMAEAGRWGIVNRVVPFDQLREAAQELIEEVISSAPLSLQRLKLTYRKTAGMQLHSAIRLDAGPDPYGTEDQIEGARAFLEKRAPVWKGR